MKKYACRHCNIDFTSAKGYKSNTPSYCSTACYSANPVSIETRTKMSLAKVGKVPWNKKDKKRLICKQCKLTFIVVKTREIAKYCSLGCRNEAYKSYDYSRQSGPSCRFWKGGITSENERARKSSAYRTWRLAVFLRDSYTCSFCGIQGGALQADHIKPFAYFKESRYDLANGRTLCVSCHRATDTYGSKALKLARV